MTRNRVGSTGDRVRVDVALGWSRDTRKRRIRVRAHPRSVVSDLAPRSPASPARSRLTVDEWGSSARARFYQNEYTFERDDVGDRTARLTIEFEIVPGQYHDGVDIQFVEEYPRSITTVGVFFYCTWSIFVMDDVVSGFKVIHRRHRR